VKGLPAVGYAYGVFPQQPARRIGMPEVLEGWEEHNQKILNQLKPGKDDAFRLQPSLEDAANGFCTPLSLPHCRASPPFDPQTRHYPELRQAACP
jgi:hypothetical protein